MDDPGDGLVIVLKKRMLTVLLFGLLVLSQSTLWEYARVQPRWRGDRFIITPWSLRGYETPQGLVILLSAAILAVLAILLVMGKIKANRVGTLTITGGLIVGAVAATFVGDARPTTVGGVGVVVLSMVGAALVAATAMRTVGSKVADRYRRWVRLGVWLVALPLMIYVVIGATVGGLQRPTWLVLAVGLALVGGVVVFRNPPQLGPYRMIIIGAAAIMLVAISMATAVRIQLTGMQFATWEAAADLREVQITWGVFMAWMGGALATMAAIGLWAGERDEVSAQNRARRQAEAARQSELELAGAATG
ncbi:MAG: hypothetical protein WEA29_09335 [Acidimicrobiia bacterium]